MTTTVFVLLMIWSTNSSHGGIGVVQQEFKSFDACEVARKMMATAHSGSERVLAAQGCFEK